MRQPTNNRRPRVPAVLWSEIFALWRDHARRPALPLLLALLLFVSAPLVASANCSPGTDGHGHEASTSHADGVAATTDDHHDAASTDDHHDAASTDDHHDAATTDDHHAHDVVATDDHHAHDAAPQVTASHKATLQAPATCCSCSSEPISATFVAVSAPKNPKADSHALVYAVVNASPVYRFDVLEGLHTRAGPPTGKPQRLSLASLIGRAPPVSL